MQNARHTVIYVGKAKKLRNRASSYFSGVKDLKTTRLVAEAASIDYLVTATEREALLLENSLIKKYKPHYNILLKDNKSYPVLRLTKESYPRLFKTRTIIRDGSEYFGPFPLGSCAEDLLQLIETRYPLRRCKGTLKRKDHPCLNYHMGLSSAPCCNKISSEEYMSRVRTIRLILKGKTKKIRSELTALMKKSSDKLEFEKAGEYKRQIDALAYLREEQGVVSFISHDTDYIALTQEGMDLVLCVVLFRNGAVLDVQIFHSEFAGNSAEALSQFLFQYYDKKDKIPPKIIFQSNFEIPVDLADAFHFGKAQSGDEMQLLRLAQRNSDVEMTKHLSNISRLEALSQLQKWLSLPTLPLRIEGFDISQLDGHMTVASLISFYEGKPDRSCYRKYRISGLADGQINDFQSMREVVTRRYTKVANGEIEAPDLILIDGGKGQVGAAKEMLSLLSLQIPVVGLAKKEEIIIFSDDREPLNLPAGTPALRILEQLRDETHRVANSYNKLLRSKKLSLTTLESIPGVGPARSEKLLIAFGSLESLKEASKQEIMEKGKVSSELAEMICSFLERRSLPFIDPTKTTSFY